MFGGAVLSTVLVNPTEVIALGGKRLDQEGLPIQTIDQRHTRLAGAIMTQTADAVTVIAHQGGRVKIGRPNELSGTAIDVDGEIWMDDNRRIGNTILSSFQKRSKGTLHLRYCSGRSVLIRDDGTENGTLIQRQESAFICVQLFSVTAKGAYKLFQTPPDQVCNQFVIDFYQW